MTYLVVIIFSFIHLLMYSAYSYRRKNYINELSFIFGLSFLMSYFLPLIYIIQFDPEHVLSYGFLINYFLLFVFHFIYFFVMSYVKLPEKFLFKYTQPKNNLFLVVLLCFLVIIILFSLNQIIQVQNLLGISPREYYASTRTNAGLAFIIFTLLATSVCISLFVIKSKYIKIAVTVLLFLFAYFLGTKSSLLSLIMIIIFYLNFSTDIRLKLAHIFYFLVLIFFAMLYLQLFQDKLFYFSRYSDYIFNAEYIINNVKTGSYGRLFIEDNFFSRVPRIFFESKPVFFGSSELSFLVNEKQTLSLRGAPAVGMGKIYAEFQLLSFVIIIISTFLNALLLKYFSSSLKKYLNLPNFILFLCFAGVPLIQVPPAVTFPEVFLLAFMIHLFCLVKLKKNV